MNARTARELGLSECYFAVMKNQNNEKYSYIKEMGLENYLKWLSDNIKEFERLYFALYDKKLLFRAAKLIKKRGLYGHEYSFYETARHILAFKHDDKSLLTISLKKAIKIEQMNKILKEVMNEAR